MALWTSEPTHLSLVILHPTSNSPLQGPEDVNGDFYIKETQNGTIMFESVAFPGKYVYMFHGKGKRRKQLQEFSVFLMVGAMGNHIYIGWFMQ